MPVTKYVISKIDPPMIFKPDMNEVRLTSILKYGTRKSNYSMKIVAVKWAIVYEKIDNYRGKEVRENGK